MSLGFLGELPSKLKEKINISLANVKQSLEKSQNLKGLGATSNIISAEESIELFNKGISENEIKAWVWYKQQFDVPMTPYKKYFLPSGDVESDILVTTSVTDIYSVNDVFVKKAEKLLKLGVVEKETETSYIFNDIFGGRYKVNKRNVTIKKSKGVDKRAIDKLVYGGVLFYKNGMLIPIQLYQNDNIYDLFNILEEDKEKIISYYSEEVYNNQFEYLKKIMPAQLSFFDPTPANRPRLNINSPEVKTFKIHSFSEEWQDADFEDYTWFLEEDSEYYDNKNVGLSLLSTFLSWINGLDSNDEKFFPNGSSAYGIQHYYISKDKIASKDKEAKSLIEENAQKDCAHLFTMFLGEVISVNDRQRLDFYWNRKYNATIAEFNYNKIPIAFKFNRKFKDFDFELRPVQREGVAFSQVNRGGCISFDVGLGKTITAICSISCALSNGECLRPLVVVPKMTYDNWMAEFGALDDVNGVLSGCYEFNDLFNLGGNPIDNSKLQEKSITLITKEGLEKLTFSKQLIEDRATFLDSLLVVRDENKSKREKTKEKKNIIKSMIEESQKNTSYDIDVLGIDYIVFDEAHFYRNCLGTIQANIDTQIKGLRLPMKGSDNAMAKRVFIICFMMQCFGNKLNFLTATPFVNRPVEVYSVLASIALDDLVLKNVSNVFVFFSTYFNFKLETVIKAKGDIGTDIVVKDIINLTSLQKILFKNIIYREAEEAGIKRPIAINIPRKSAYKNHVLTELPEEEKIITHLVASDRQLENQLFIKGQLQKGDKKKFLKYLVTDLPLNTVSPYIYEGDLDVDYKEFVENSVKIDFVCRCIKQIKAYHDRKKTKGGCSGIVIYCEKGVEWFDKIQSYLNDEKLVGFNRYVKYDGKTLNEVELIHSKVPEYKKELIMNAFNDGVVKVIIGSSSISTGINLQKKATHLFVLYVPWNPTDLHQVYGRVHRQGNEHNYVQIIMPLVKDSADVFLAQKLDEKMARINGVWRRVGKNDVLPIDDFDPEEVKYALIDDPNVIFHHEMDLITRDDMRIERLYKDTIDKIREWRTIKENCDYYAESLGKDLKQYMANVLYYTTLSYTQDDKGNDIPPSYDKPYLMNRPTEEDFKKMTKKEKETIENNCNKFDDLQGELSNYAIKTNSEKLQLARKVLDFTRQSNWEYDTLKNYVKKLSASQRSILKILGIDEKAEFNEAEVEAQSNILNQKYIDAQAVSQSHKSQDFQDELMKDIVARMNETNKYSTNPRDLAREIAKFNYLMDYPFDSDNDPTNELPTFEYSKEEYDKWKAQQKATYKTDDIPQLLIKEFKTYFK